MRVAVDDTDDGGWDIVEYKVVVFELNDPSENVEYGIIAVVDDVDSWDIDGIVIDDKDMVWGVFVFVDAAVCDEAAVVAVPKEEDIVCGDGLVTDDDDWERWDDSDVGVEVIVDWVVESDTVGNLIVPDNVKSDWGYGDVDWSIADDAEDDGSDEWDIGELTNVDSSVLCDEEELTDDPESVR